MKLSVLNKFRKLKELQLVGLYMDLSEEVMKKTKALRTVSALDIIK
jgi:hypothetical protein